MGATMNLAMTSLGFAVSAVFLAFVLLRLLWARFQPHLRAFFPAAAAFRSLLFDRRATGMDPGTLSSFPTIRYTKKVFTSVEDAICSICLVGYEESEIIRIMPQCGHAFHINCIDVWLQQHSTCPICRLYLQCSPAQRNMPSPLLSTAARCRFSPGVILDGLFEHPLLTLGSVTSTGENCAHKSQTFNNFQGCECSCEADARVACTDIESLTMSSNLCLPDKHFDEAAECSSNNNLEHSRSSAISYGKLQLEQDSSWEVNSGCQVRENSRVRPCGGNLMPWKDKIFHAENEAGGSSKFVLAECVQRGFNETSRG